MKYNLNIFVKIDYEDGMYFEKKYQVEARYTVELVDNMKKFIIDMCREAIMRGD